MPHLLSGTTQDFPGHRIYFMTQSNIESGNIMFAAAVCGDAFKQNLVCLSSCFSMFCFFIPPFHSSNEQH